MAGDLSSPTPGSTAYKRLLFQDDDLVIKRDNGTANVAVNVDLNVTGSAPVPIEDKMFAIVSIEDFGAVSGATEDNSNAIQAAIDYVYSQGGGIVTLPPGEFGISRTIRLINDVMLQGQGHFNTLIFGLASFYTNTQAAYNVATDSENIEDEDGWPCLLSCTGGSSTRPSQSHIRLKDFGMYPVLYDTWKDLSNADKLKNATGMWGMLYESEFHNVSSSGFQRCFNVGFNNGTITGTGFSYYGGIGLRVFDAVGLVVAGHSWVGNVLNIDIIGCTGGTFDTHHETTQCAYRIGPKVFNAHILLNWAFNIENCPIVVHPNAKAIITGNTTQSQFMHQFVGPVHQSDAVPKIVDGYGYINHVPDGDMLDNTLTPAYWTKSGGGAAVALHKRRAIRKYLGTNETLNNYTGKPKLWCYPGGVAGNESTFEVQSSSIAALGFLDVRFDCNADVGVKVQITDTGDSDAVLYDSGFIVGQHVTVNSAPRGEVVIAGDLTNLGFAATGPFVMRFTTDSPDGFVVSRAMMYKAVTALNIDMGPHSTLANGIQTASAATITVDSTADFPTAGRLASLDTNNQWLTITYTGKTATEFTGCTWSRRFTALSVNNLADNAPVYRYFDNPSTSFQGFTAYDFKSGPDGGDNQSFRMIVSDLTTQDYPHHTMGWMKGLGNPALLGTENSVLSVYDTTPSGTSGHNAVWLPNGGTFDDYDSGWTFVDILSSTSFYLYLQKRAANVRIAGLGTLKPIEMYNGKYIFASTPAEGWWRVGDEALVGGVPFVCTVAGAPGTWTSVV